MSTRFNLSVTDVKTASITAIMVAVSAAITYLIPVLTNSGDIGPYGPLIIVGLTFAQKLIQKWIADHPEDNSNGDGKNKVG